MAKLEAYYTLCPLIDQQNLLGVKKDAETGCAIVTLGRNIVIRYKLQDLKQISSWSSKERLTSEIIYDTTTDKYVAVFNEKFIKVWSEDETTLDSVKKYKFNTPVNKIITHDGIPPIVVLQNGATASLPWTLDKKNRKQWNSQGFLKKGEQILECQLIDVNHKTYLCAFTKIDKVYNYVVIPLQEETFFEEVGHLTRIELKRAAETLVGHTVIHDKNKAHILSLWSHGRLYSYPITSASSESAPGALVSVVKSVNTNHPVVMVPLNESTIAMYGADAAEEGAFIAIYNVQFKLTQAAKNLKLHTKEAKLWKIDDKLLLAANRHLAVIPFRLAAEKIGAMVGSSLNLKINSNNSDNEDIMIIQESTIENWEDPKSKPMPLNLNKLSSQLPKAVAKRIKSYVNEGLDDGDILSSIMTELIEKKNVPSIVWCLDNFKDVPEKLILDLLLFGLRTEDHVFKPMQNGHSHNDSHSSERINSRNKFLNKIFGVANSDMYLLGYLKTSLKFEEALRLLDYLIERLDDGNEVTEGCVLNYKQIYEWTSLLLDSHYQQYLLSQDKAVLEKLNRLSETLESHIQLLKDLENLRPMMKRAIDGKSLKIAPKNSSKFYTIEDIKLY